MAAVATVILAHGDPVQTRRLCAAMAGTDRFLHCDQRTPDDVFSAMTDGLDGEVTAVSRHRTTRTSWSLVAAEITALGTALRSSRAEHIVVMSGSCYPLASIADLGDELAMSRGFSQMSVFPLPHAPWGTPRNPDGGLWRFNRRFTSLRGQALHVRGLPVRTVRRRIPRELSLHGASQWKIYARAHAAALVELMDTRSDLRDFFAHSYVPDETCAATILSSPALVGDLSDQVIRRNRWLMQWDGGESPAWLDGEALEQIRARRVNADDGRPGPEGEALFARKLRSAQEWLLDQIDEERRR